MKTAKAPAKQHEPSGLIIDRSPGESFTIGPITVTYRHHLDTGLAGFHTDDPELKKTYDQALRQGQVIGLRQDVVMKILRFEGQRVYIQIKAPKSLSILRHDAKKKEKAA